MRRLREIRRELVTLLVMLAIVCGLARLGRADEADRVAVTETAPTASRALTIIPGPSEWAKATSAELVCEHGHLFERLCYGENGGRPCTLSVPRELSPEDRREWRACGGMSVLGTVAIMSLISFGDVRSTAAVYDAGTGQEANPFLAGRTDVAVSLNISGAKLLDVAATTFAIHLIERHHPRLARWLRRARVVGGMAIVAWNVRQAREGKR